MVEIDKVQREHISNILHSLHIDAVDKSILNRIMRVLSPQNDAVFAKTLFSDKIVSINRQHLGEYEKFLASQDVSDLPYVAKCLLFSVFRRYSEAKIKLQHRKQTQTSSHYNISQLSMPDSNNIQETIKFQKTMFHNLKHLIPKPDNNHQQSIPLQTQPSHNHDELISFRFNPYENSFRQIDPQYLTSIQNPLLPEFNNRFFIAPYNYEPQNKPAHFMSFRSEPFMHNEELFSKLSYPETKRQLQNLAEFESKNFSLLNPRSFLKEQEASPKGFTAFSLSDLSSMPQKKVKRDSFVVYTPESLRRVNEEIEMYKKSLQSSAKKENAQKESAMGELHIKHSISEYLAEDRHQPHTKRQEKQ